MHIATLEIREVNCFFTWMPAPAPLLQAGRTPPDHKWICEQKWWQRLHDNECDHTHSLSVKRRQTDIIIIGTFTLSGSCN